MFNYLLKSIIPIIAGIVITYGMIRGRKVYEGDVITFEDQEIKVIR